MKKNHFFDSLFLLFSNIKFAIVSWLGFHFISLYYVYNNFSINIFWVFSFYTLMLFLLGLMFIIINTKYIHSKSELEKNKSMFEEIFNFSSDAIFITKPPLNQIIDCNQTALKMFEIANKKDIIGKKGHIFHLHPLSEEDIEKIKNKIKKNVAYELQLEYKTHNNNIFWGHLNGSPMHILNEEFTINRISDISLIKHQEEQLKSSIDKFQTLFDSSVDALFIVDKTTFLILDCNQKAIEMFDAKNKSALIGINGASFQVRDFSEKEIEYITEKNQSGQKIEFELEYETFNKKRFWGHLISTPIVIDNVSCNFVRVSDVSSRKNTELSLFKNQKLTDLIAEISPIQIWIHDIKNQKIDYANKAFYNIVGYTPEEVITLGPAYFDLSIYPDDIPLMQSLIEKIYDMQDDDTLNFQHRVIDKSKNVHWQEFRIRVFERDAKGNVIKIIGNSIDITETKETESKLIDTNKELKQINEELDAFVYRASHDLRAPLTSVLGLLNLTQIENKDPETVAYVPLMQKSIERLLDVINDLINFSKNSRLEISSEKIDFVALTKDVFNEFLYLENASHIELIIEKNIDFDFYSDYMRLYLLFNNLISNAIKYHDFSKQKQYIKISIESNNQNAKITVQDNGLGIADEYKDRIFNMFFRANAASTGSGLGLYIVKGILEKLKGSINMESKRSEGTSFIVEIPNSIYLQN
ncbi:MAG: PAS domain S-box protein [Bacteroidetes bacterium]|nr:MAG: PAS domain S-box protein [Bacteroidota bacterium]